MKSIFICLLTSFLMISCDNSVSTKAQDLENMNLFFSKEKVTSYISTEYSRTDIFTLHEDSYLNIHFILDEPLVKSLQELAPRLTEDQLLEIGNFQFTFLVDGVAIYQESLSKGAGSKISKTEQLNHTIPLISPEPMDYWGWFMWLKFMKLGDGQDALYEGVHSLKIEVRPYIGQDSIITGPILAEGLITIETADIPIDQSLVPVQVIQPNSGWAISKEGYDISKIEALNKKIAEGRFNDINGIVVIKEGQLLIEEYFNGEERDSLHDSRSVGKSLASTMLGIAIDEKYIASENITIKNFYDLKKYDNYSKKKDSVTLKSLLTMSSAFMGDDSDYSSPGNEENMYPTKDWVKFTLDLPMEEEKEIGEEFIYFTAGVVVLGDIVHKSVPRGLIDYADKKLFGPLGITEYQWEYTPQQVGNTAGGIRLRALDFAKYGQLYKNKGLWNGKKILSEEWIEKSMDKLIVNPANNGYYSYLFWNKVYNYNDQEIEVSYSSGNGGNYIFIFKDLPFVVVITASAYNDPSAHPNVDKMMKEYILPSLL